MAATSPPALSKSMFMLIPDQAPYLVRLQALAAGEEVQLDQHPAAGDLAAGLRNQLAAGLERAAGGQQVVDQEHAGAGLEAVDVHVQLGLAIFEVVLQLVSLIGKLARLAQR